MTELFLTPTAAVLNGFLELPTTYSLFAHRISLGIKYIQANFNFTNCCTPWGFLNEVKQHASINWTVDVSVVILFAVLWMVLRSYVVGYAAKIAVRRGMPPKNAQKFPESFWKCLIRSFTAAYTAYVLFGMEENRHIFFYPDSVWSDHKFGVEVDSRVYYLYMIQLASYVPSIYFSLFGGAMRKDDLVTLIHHLITVALISFSYAVRFHKIGLLVLMLHNPSDVLLELAKCCIYLKYTKAADISFYLFAASWYVLRLYWFPLKVLQSTGYGTIVNHQTYAHEPDVLDSAPFYVYFNGLLWMLLLLHIIWATIITSMAYKKLTGRMAVLTDVREEDDNNQSPDTHRYRNGSSHKMHAMNGASSVTRNVTRNGTKSD